MKITIFQKRTTIQIKYCTDDLNLILRNFIKKYFNIEEL